MKHLLCTIAAAALLTTQAFADDTQTGTVCGRVLAPSDLTQTYATDTINNPGIVIARSGNQEVQTTIGYDGSYCFDHLLPELYTLTAFGDGSFNGYAANVTPQSGRTVNIDLSPGPQ